MKRVVLLCAFALLGAASVAGARTGAGGPAGTDFHAPLNCSTKPTAQQLLSYKVPKAKKRYQISLMEVSLNGYYYVLLAYGAEQAAKQAGVDLRITAASGYTTPAIQLQQAEDVISKGTDGVVFAPVDINGSVPAVNKFKARKIPVVQVSTQVNSPYPYTVMQDDYLMGKALADQMHKLAPKGGEGIFMAGPSNATWSRKRVAGFEDQVKAKYPDMKVVDAPTSLVDPGEALTKLTASLQAHPKITWLASVDYSLPVPQAIPSPYNKLPYATMGFDPNTQKAVQGGFVKTTLPTDAYYMGYLGVGTVVGLLNGQEEPRVQCTPYLPGITKANATSTWAQKQLYPASYKPKTG
ncbi:MAG TPA: sugar ABC transporter substrate-binding protein [Gaiellaceae bacterium]|nr:sugar ABC transporter substrate-binding protein [Gaiellaceae bacterium]